MTMTDIHNEFTTEAIIRPCIKKTHAAAMRRPQAERIVQNVRRLVRTVKRMVPLMQSAGFATAAMIITTLMTFALSREFPLISI